MLAWISCIDLTLRGTYEKHCIMSLNLSLHHLVIQAILQISNPHSTYSTHYCTKIGVDFVSHFALISPFRGGYKWWHIWDCAIPISSTFYPTYFIYLWVQAHTLRCFKGNRQQCLNLNNNFGIHNIPHFSEQISNEFNDDKENN